MKKKVISVVLVIVLAVGSASLILQLMRVLPQNNQTFVTSLYTQKQTLTVPIIALREEVVLKDSVNGLVDYHYENGVKVVNGMSVASVYSNETDVVNAHKIEQLQSEIVVLQSASQQNADASYSNILAQQAWNEMSVLTGKVQDSDLSNVQQYKSNLTEIFNARNAATGKGIDFSARISELETEIAALKSQTGIPNKEIETPASGFFVSTVDGYENFATLEEIYEMNASDLESIIQSTTKEETSNLNVAGKIITGYDWHVIALVPNEQLATLEGVVETSSTRNWNHRKEKIVDFTVTFNEPESFQGILVQTKTRQGEDKSIVIFECSSMSANLATLRKKEAEIFVSENTGLRVPRSAIRFNNEDEPGVFISIGNEVQFRKLDIIYFDNDYALSAVHDDVQGIRRYLQKDDVVLLDSSAYNQF